MKKLTLLSLIIFACSSSREPQHSVEIGETLITPYFDITLNSFQFRSSIDGYLPFEGNIFLTMDFTYKNNNQFPRIIQVQGLGIVNDGHHYWSERDYIIEVGGYGEHWLELQPGESANFKCAFQITEGLSGDANFYPGKRYDGDQMIHLGQLEAKIKPPNL